MCTAKGVMITLLLVAKAIGNTLKNSQHNNKDNILHTTWAIKASFLLVADDFNINQGGIKRGQQRKT